MQVEGTTARHPAGCAQDSLTRRAEHQRLHVAGALPWSPSSMQPCNKAEYKNASTRALSAPAELTWS